MANGAPGLVGFLVRLLFAFILVFATYNPGEYSYFHWVQATAGNIAPEKAFVGVVLLIGWIAYVRAAINSLGPAGIALTFAFFGTLLWLIIDRGLVSVESRSKVVWLVEVVLAFVLAVGMSWSYVKRRVAGQYTET